MRVASSYFTITVVWEFPLLYEHLWTNACHRIVDIQKGLFGVNCVGSKSHSINFRHRMLIFCSYSYCTKKYITYQTINMMQYVGQKNSALAAASPPPAVPATVMRTTQQYTVKLRNCNKTLNNETTKAQGNLLPSPTSFTCTDGRTVRKDIRLHMPLTQCERQAVFNISIGLSSGCTRKALWRPTNN